MLAKNTKNTIELNTYLCSPLDMKCNRTVARYITLFNLIYTGNLFNHIIRLLTPNQHEDNDLYLPAIDKALFSILSRCSNSIISIQLDSSKSFGSIIALNSINHFEESALSKKLVSHSSKASGTVASLSSVGDFHKHPKPFQTLLFCISHVFHENINNCR